MPIAVISWTKSKVQLTEFITRIHYLSVIYRFYSINIFFIKKSNIL